MVFYQNIYDDYFNEMMGKSSRRVQWWKLLAEREFQNEINYRDGYLSAWNSVYVNNKAIFGTPQRDDSATIGSYRDAINKAVTNSIISSTEAGKFLSEGLTPSSIHPSFDLDKMLDLYTLYSLNDITNA